MKGYRTLIFAALLAGLSAAQLALPSVQALIPPAAYSWATMGVAIIVAVLRVVTTTPVLESAP